MNAPRLIATEATALAMQGRRMSLQGIAFEEGRLRQQALQAEAPAAKREEYAIETVVRPALQRATRWFPSQINPPAPSAGCGGDLLPPSFAQAHAGSAGATFEEAASAYREFRRCFDAGDARAEEIWRKSLPDGVEHADLFRELHGRGLARSDAQQQSENSPEFTKDHVNLSLSLG